MFSFSSVLNAGGIFGNGISLRQKRKQAQTRLQQLKQDLRAQLAALDEKYQPKFQRLKQATVTRLAAFDEKYQGFMQTHIDPLLGNSQRSQLQVLLDGDALTLRPEERVANRRLGMGLTALSFA